MRFADSLLPEFDMEVANTRKVLERVPDERFGWTPHPKSFSMGKLASHLATLPGWTMVMIGRDSFDFASGEFRPAVASNRKELLDEFDRVVKQAREKIAAADDEEFTKPWTLKNGPQVIFTRPKAAVIRSFVLNHAVHHRAQLGVYLRLNDIPVPAIYGPSADER